MSKYTDDDNKEENKYLNIAPVSPTGTQGKNAKGAARQTSGVDREAVRIVENADLLAEVLRRAVLIDPEAVKRALANGQARMKAARGKAGRYGQDIATPETLSRLGLSDEE